MWCGSCKIMNTVWNTRTERLKRETFGRKMVWKLSVELWRDSTVCVWLRGSHWFRWGRGTRWPGTAEKGGVWSVDETSVINHFVMNGDSPLGSMAHVWWPMASVSMTICKLSGDVDSQQTHSGVSQGLIHHSLGVWVRVCTQFMHIFIIMNSSTAYDGDLIYRVSVHYSNQR